MLNNYVKTAAFLILTGVINPMILAEEAPIISHPTTTPAAPTPPAPSAAPQPQIARATFTTNISAREPANAVTRISAGQTVYYFTELVGLQGHVITHRWEKDGAFQLGLQFPVGGQRWRVHSNKTISPTLPGTWTVTVINDDGSTLRQDTLIVDPITPSEPTPTPVPAPAVALPTAAPPPNVTTPAIETPKDAATPEKNSQAIWDTLTR
ncbi:Protein of unknown function [Thiothrix caldifontis]|uniref:DUF2914 domain-containing protein n=1 Tax=Thiothrix caldifontis TaxID=525918 RepID=A0A1H3VS11_9GAMM|nr:DUF2914 domain-containing protein [Thiothrix caldifontis]SDZ77550.1 Protein of unknown function [Thiothrix caldifontis]